MFISIFDKNKVFLTFFPTLNIIPNHIGFILLELLIAAFAEIVFLDSRIFQLFFVCAALCADIN
jgi:hypothetical protein